MSRATTDISLTDQSLNHTPDNFLDSDDTYTLLCTLCSLGGEGINYTGMILIAGQLARPEDPGRKHGEGLLDRAHLVHCYIAILLYCYIAILLDGAHQDGREAGVEAGARLDEDVHHVGGDHVDARPLGDHHQGPDPLQRMIHRT